MAIPISAMFYEPKKVDLKDIPSSLLDDSPFIEAERSFQKDRAQQLANQRAEQLLEDHDSTKQAEALLRAAYADGTPPDMEEVANIVGSTGNVRDYVTLQSGLRAEGREERTAQNQLVSLVTGLAQYNPELAQVIAEQEGLSEKIPGFDVSKFKPKIDIKGSPKTGMYHVDPRTGEVVIDREPAAKQGGTGVKQPKRAYFKDPDGNLKVFDQRSLSVEQEQQMLAAGWTPVSGKQSAEDDFLEMLNSGNTPESSDDDDDESEGEDGDTISSALKLLSQLGGASAPSTDSDLVTVYNKKTGERKRVTRAEAQKLQSGK